MAPHASAHLLKPHEEEWRGVFNNLSERFPSIAAPRIVQALRDNDGHAGGAARFLRDLTSSNVKEMDADDIEHVATLLSSPVMFKHACKEQFRKFDINHDGALEWDEVKALTMSVYEEFGLPIPSEGSLRAFFVANDINHDGVLSEREFRKFFEMFLRYAFFEPMKLRQVVEKGMAIDASRGGNKVSNKVSISEASTEISSGASTSRGTHESSKDQRSEDHPKISSGLLDICKQEIGQHMERRTPIAGHLKSPSRQHKLSTPKAEQLASSPSHNSHGARRTPQGGQDKHHRKSRQKDQEHEHSMHQTTSLPNLHQSQSLPNVSEGKLRCLAPQGVAFRATPAFKDKLQSAVGKGESVRILEHWVRTPEGWLPMTDPQGHGLFEKQHEEASHNESRRKVSIQHVQDTDLEMRSVSRSPCRRKAEGLRSNEEAWRPVFNNLSERFPQASSDKIAEALRENDGHAGKAAQMLRSM
jgi:hypothetical protein